MANTPKLLLAPVHIFVNGTLGNSQLNLYQGTTTPNGGSTNANMFDIIRHIHVSCVTGGNFSLYFGTTSGGAAGGELASAFILAAGGVWDYYGQLKMLSTYWFAGNSSAASLFTVTVEGESGVL